MTFVQFTNPRTQKPVWVNPKYIRNVRPVIGREEWTELAMGGEGQDVTVEGYLKPVLEILRGDGDGSWS